MEIKIFDEKEVGGEGEGGNSVSFESPVLIIKLSCDVIITCNYMKYNIRKRMFKQ
jgi:hypothetical protein